MTTLQAKDLRRFADVMRLRTGVAVAVRFVEPNDVDALRRYFEALSPRTHYNRFLGATRAVPQSEFERMLRTGEAHHFAVLAETAGSDARTIIGEARYALDPKSQAVEFGISVADSWRRQGAGAALLSNLECRAAALGAERIFGDALTANHEMLGLARKRGYHLTHPPGDWKLLRFEKEIRTAQDVPCIQSTRVVPLLAAAG